jgi:hypothetical protein
LGNLGARGVGRCGRLGRSSGKIFGEGLGGLGRRRSVGSGPGVGLSLAFGCEVFLGGYFMKLCGGLGKCFLGRKRGFWSI